MVSAQDLMGIRNVVGHCLEEGNTLTVFLETNDQLSKKLVQSLVKNTYIVNFVVISDSKLQ